VRINTIMFTVIKTARFAQKIERQSSLAECL
jgi:hypothetical protein